MRHRWAHRKLGRKTEHRLATLRNLASQLIVHERIETTVEKAKELRSYVEKLITTAREDSVHNRRQISRKVSNYKLSSDPKSREDVLKRLFNDVAPRFSGRPGGYTRILRTETRRGDAAEMAILELVVRKEKEAAPPPTASEKKKGGLAGLAQRVAGRGRKKAAAADEKAGE
ncbi:MAG: 50S ribosomal protein L17 [Acidobacteriota bacterium]